MAESLAHMTYVRNIASFVESRFPECQQPVLFADLPEYGRTPQVMGGHFPDLYARTPRVFIIGEAKTDRDIDNPHTASQIECYIKELRTAISQEKHLVLATSFFAFPTLKNMIVRKKMREGIEDITFHVLDSNNRIETI